MFEAQSSSNGGAAAILVIVLIGFYFLPLIIALVRHVPNVGSVAVINFFLGWTFIGWIVALAMACRSAPPVQQVRVYNQPPPVQRPYVPPAPPQPLTAPPGLAAPSVPATQPPTAAAWYPDPLGRSRLRYYDRTQWTDHVSD